ncbi:hypothetical protein [Nonomuraea wenchangensis]|uniref:hypothetical protein n=1 Tax=Nonomuraea wenchangensis TaxID=568860 RepID=UPI003316CC5B
MFDSDAAIAKRYETSRPGLRLLAIADAALPVTQLTVDVLAQERKPLPLLDEFIIRLTDMGIRDPSQMASVLGLDVKLTESAVVEQLAADNIVRLPGEGTLVELTPQGRIMAVELESTRPVQRPLPITFDRLTWAVASYRPEFLVQKKEAEEAGLIILPAARSQRVIPSDVTVASLNKLITDSDSREGHLDILAVERVSPKKHRYFPVKLLIFADEARTEVQLGVVVEDQLSPLHERALLSIGGPDALGITIEEPAERPSIPDDLEIVRIPREIQTPELCDATDEAESTTPSMRGNIEVRDISVHEHPEFLKEALTDSTRRLLIIAPWIKNSVVDTAFIGSIERLLRRKVRVHIAYGIGDDDRGSHERAISRLKSLAERFKEHFTFVRLKNSHAKILISDGTWINTSFNWLSFRGDPSRTYRMEEGILIRSPIHVDDAYAKYLRMIDEQSVTP